MQNHQLSYLGPFYSSLSHFRKRSKLCKFYNAFKLSRVPLSTLTGTSLVCVRECLVAKIRTFFCKTVQIYLQGPAQWVGSTALVLRGRGWVVDGGRDNNSLKRFPVMPTCSHPSVCKTGNSQSGLQVRRKGFRHCTKPEVVSKSAWLHCQFTQQASIIIMLSGGGEGRGNIYIATPRIPNILSKT